MPPIGGVPPGWTCAAFKYDEVRRNDILAWRASLNVEATCDCGCGVWDPDCDLQVDPYDPSDPAMASPPPQMPVSGCESERNNGYVRCAAGDAPTSPPTCAPVPEGWDLTRCAAAYFNQKHVLTTAAGAMYGGSVEAAAYDGAVTCQCGCGAYDPDCAHTTYEAVNSIGCGDADEALATYPARDDARPLGTWGIYGSYVDYSSGVDTLGEHGWYAPFIAKTEWGTWNNGVVTSEMREKYTCDVTAGSVAGACVIKGSWLKASGEPQVEGWKCPRRGDGYSRFGELQQLGVLEWSDNCKDSTWPCGWWGTEGPQCDVGCGVEDPDCDHLRQLSALAQRLNGRTGTWTCELDSATSTWSCGEPEVTLGAVGGFCACDEVAHPDLWPDRYAGCHIESVASCACGGDTDEARAANNARQRAEGMDGYGTQHGFITGEVPDHVVAPPSVKNASFYECTAEHSCKDFFVAFPHMLPAGYDPADFDGCTATAAKDDWGDVFQGCSLVGNRVCEDAEAWSAANGIVPPLPGPFDVYNYFNLTEYAKVRRRARCSAAPAGLPSH